MTAILSFERSVKLARVAIASSTSLSLMGPTPE